MQVVPFSLEEDAEFSCVLIECRDSWPSRWAHCAGRWEGRSGAGRRMGAWSRDHLHAETRRDGVLLNRVEDQDYSQNPGTQDQRLALQKPAAC